MPTSAGLDLTNGDEVYASIMSSSRWYTSILVANCALCAALFPLVVFLVVRKSAPEMSACVRTLLLNSNCTCMAAALVQTVWIPVPLHPVFGGISLGVFSGCHLGVQVVVFGVWIALLANTPTNYLFAFAHYYALMKPNWRTGSVLFGKVTSPHFCTLYALFWVLIVFLVCGILSVVASPSELYQKVMSTPPGHFYRVLYANQHSLMDMDNIAGDGLHVVWLAALGCVVLFEIGAIFGMNVGIVLEIHRTKDIVQSNTHNMQVTAYVRLFLVKSMLLAVFFFLPLFVIGLAYIGTFSQLEPQLFSYLFFAFHSLVVMLQTILLVRSYREWTFAALKWLCMRILCRPQPVTGELCGAAATASVHPMHQRQPQQGRVN